MRRLITSTEIAALRTKIRNQLKDGITVNQFITTLDDKTLRLLIHLSEKELKQRNSRFQSIGNRHSMIEE